MKKTPSNKQGRLSPTKIIVLIVTAVLVILPVWNWYVHYQDKQKFMTLKQDMLSLQTEFNKIDSGWEYSEWCHAKGEKFKENEASGCGITLKNTIQDISPYLGSLPNNVSAKGDTSYVDDQGLKHDNRSVIFLNNRTMKCEFTSHLYNIDSSSAWFSCSGSALDFYFPKTQ